MKDEESQKSFKNILSKSTVHKAPADISQRVLEAWKTHEAILTPAPPIIPTRVWWGLLTAIAALTIYTIADSNPKSDKWTEYFSWMKIDFELLMPAPDPVLLISLVAIGVMILFNIALVWKKGMG